MEVVWTDKAIYENEKNIDFLYENWNYEVVVEYIEKVEKFTNLLESNPRMGMYDEEIRAYKFLVVPQIYAFYDIIGEIILLKSFWNNNQKPYW